MAKLTKVQLEKLRKGLAEVIEESCKHKNSKVLDMQRTDECALGNFYPDSSFINIFQKLFGFTPRYTVDAIKKDDVTNIQKEVALLFAGHGNDNPENLITVSDWRKNAKKVLKKIDRKILERS